MSDRCPDCGCEVPDSGSGVPEADCVVCELQDMITALRAERDRLRALLRRYRNETPPGHQPHMIAAEVDAVLEGTP